MTSGTPRCGNSGEAGPEWLCTVLVQAGVIIVMAFTSVAFGGVHVASATVSRLIILALFSIWMVRILLSRRGAEFTSQSSPAKAPRGRFWRVLAVCTCAVLCLGVFQLVPLPHGVTAAIAPGLAEAYAYALSGTGKVGHPISAFPFATRAALTGLLTYVMFFLVVRYNVTTDRDARRMLWAMLAIGAGVCLVAFLQWITRTQSIYWFWQSRYGRSSFGTYVNRNTFASHLELLIPIAFALALCRPPNEGPAHSLARRITGIGLTILLCTGLFMTLSRAAVLAIMTTALLAVPLIVLKGRRASTKLIAVGVAALVLMFAWVATGDRIYSRFVELARGNISGRLLIWRDTLYAVADSPVVGFGLGCYRYALPPYKMPDSLHNFVTHAHSEYIHYLLEVGVPGLTLLLVIVGLLLLKSAYEISRRADTTLRYALTGGLFGCMCVLIHSAFTVSLHMPATLLVFICILALGTQAPPAGAHDGQGLARRTEGLGAAARSLAIGGLILAAFLAKSAISQCAATDAYYQAMRLAEADPEAVDAQKTLFAKSLHRSSDFAPASYVLARLLSEGAGERDEEVSQQIERLYKQAIVDDPLNAEYHYALGVFYANTGRDKEAELQFVKAALFAPDDPFYKYNQGLFLHENGLTEKALSAYAAALTAQLKKGKPNPGPYLERVYEDLVQVPRGVALVRTIVPPDPHMRVSLAFLLKADGKEEDALAELTFAASLAREPALRAKIAKTFIRWGRLDAAVELLQKYCKASPHDVSLKRALADTYLRQKDTETGIALLEEIVRDFPGDRAAALRLADIYSERGRFDEAEKTYQNLIAACPFDWGVARSQGMFYLGRGDYTRAGKAFRQGISMDDTNADAYYCLGLALEKDRDISGALEAFSKASELRPNRSAYGIALERTLKRKQVLKGVLKGDTQAP